VAGRYAADTSVSSESSRAEIERTLSRYGANQFMYGWGEHEGHEVAIVGFRAHDRQIRFNLVLPDRNSREFTHTPARGHKRSDTEAIKAYEQAVRQRWRALALTIKALLEAIEVGILSFEEAFMAHIMLPDGSSVGQAVLPKVAEAYDTGTMPSLLPTYRKAIEA
jgi:hypothetical protein